MCFNPSEMHRQMMGKGHGDCCGGKGIKRRFISKREEMDMLKDYQRQLKDELEGLEEHIQESKSK